MRSIYSANNDSLILSKLHMGMVSNGDKRFTDEIQEELGSMKSINNSQTRDQISLDVQTSHKEFLDSSKHLNKFLDIFRTGYRGPGFKKLGPSPSAKFRQLAYARDEFSRSIRSEEKPPEHFYVQFIRKIDWSSLWAMSKEWIKNPMNLALFVWIVCVAVSGAILFLVMTGMLNAALPRKSQRDTWFEVNNQILNALFTLMCLYQHPKRIYHFVLLCRWEEKDILALRKIYCKNGTYKPDEWLHMMVVVLLLNLNCFAQYALCGLNLGYSRSERPAIGVALCISVAIGAPAFASVYNILSPLGKEYDTDIDLEKHGELVSSGEIKPAPDRKKSFQKKYSMKVREGHGVEESKPEWVGGLFDFWDDISLAYLSVFCSCCVFGWNMERLGFGNMYVHIMTFVLFCVAPFFIFNLAALNLNNEVVREALGISGILLCFFGLLYGGFWRIQMRKKYNLPGSKFCCDKPSMTDCMQWLFCCSCSLAQEVRTADYYEIVEDKFNLKQINENGQMTLLPCEEGSSLFRSTPSSPYRETSSPSIFKMEYQLTPSRLSGAQTPERQLPQTDSTTSPPVQSKIQREDNQTL